MAYSLKGLLREMEKTYAAFKCDWECKDCDYEMDLRSYQRFCYLLNFFFKMQFSGSYIFEYNIWEDNDDC